MEVQNRMQPNVRISYDEMEAYLTLPVASGEEVYTSASILNALQKSNVTTGIDQEMINNMIQEEIYGREMVVAHGTPVIDGADGYYEYNFNTDINNKPEIRPDGSVDYWSIHAVEIVEEGQVIAIYHEPVAGSNGITVKGKVKAAKRGRPQSQLRGIGFERSEDNRIYTSLMDGKIEMKNGRIMISSVYEIYGNADVSTGNIDFRGDVIIHGNVATGSKIIATGFVTIDGSAEACEIRAGKDIILRGGMMGQNRASMRSKGNIFAKFIEYALIECDGAIQVNSFLDCEVVCGDKVYVNGKQGTIVGGNIYGVRGIEAYSVGNASELQTEIRAGVGLDTIERIHELEDQLDQIQENIQKIEVGLRQFDEMGREKGIDVKNNPQRVALLRTKIVKQADLAAAEEELGRLDNVVENAKGAIIRIENFLYPGVLIYIDDSNVLVKEIRHGVELEQSAGKLRMYALQD